MRIAVVEDDALIRYLMVFKLGGRGHHIEPFTNGAEALEFYMSNSLPDLILTDIMMPKMGGIEFTSKIREIDKKIPIVAITCDISNIELESKSMFTLWVEKNGSIDDIIAIIFQGLIEKKLV
jgi:CheY-like chemotaxis protein